MGRHQSSATGRTCMPCKQFLGKQKGQVPTAWFGYAKAHQSLTVEGGMACRAGGACLHVGARGSLLGGQCSPPWWPWPSLRGCAFVSPLQFRFRPLLRPFAEAAWPLPSLTAQPRDSKIQFISSINSINKQNSTDQRTSIAINTAIHVAKWSYFS